MLIPILGQTTVHLLEIRVEYDLKNDPRAHLVGAYVSVPDPDADYLESMDIHSFALQIAERAPTLGHVGVEITGLPAPQMYWQVVRSSESTQVSLLDVGDFSDGHRRFWRSSEDMEE